MPLCVRLIQVGTCALLCCQLDWKNSNGASFGYHYVDYRILHLCVLFFFEHVSARTLTRRVFFHERVTHLSLVRIVLFSILISETIVDVPSGGLYVLIEFPILLYFTYVTNYLIMWYVPIFFCCGLTVVKDRHLSKF